VDDDRLEANRRNWDDRTAVHLRSRFYDVEGWLRRRPGPPAFEVEVLGDLAGRTLLHLQCHFGLDTLAWAGAGAHVTGLDFSSPAIEAARELAVRAGLADRARFVCANVYDAVEALDHQRFDVVYVSLGALCWLPSVDRWAAQVGGLVAPGGTFYLHDAHPLAAALADQQPIVASDYFEEAEPYVDDEGWTYTDASGPVAHRRCHAWNHGLGETVTALLRHGLRIDTLVEHDWTVFRAFPWLVDTGDGRWSTPPGTPRLPLSYTVTASLER
jgi:SAM-dependent methyltransferase